MYERQRQITIEDMKLWSESGEHWAVCRDSDGRYLISNFGRLVGLRCSRGWLNKPFQQRLSKSRNGYICFGFRLASGQRVRRSVHREVAYHFVPGFSPDLQVNHIDGDKENNCASNLEWVDRFANIKHSWKLGLRKKYYGMENGNVKLSDEQVINIRHARGAMSQHKLAKLYGVAQASISRIQTNRSRLHALEDCTS